MEKEKKNENNKNAVRNNRRFRINIGIVIFAFVLVYFLIYLFQYLTQTHVSIYEVENGQIMMNSTYTGLVLRSETVTYADESGKINYYCKEGEKVGYGDLICSIDSEGQIYQKISAAGLDGTTLTTDELLNVQALITDYSDGYSPDQFYDVYSFGQNLNAEVQENLYLTALDDLGEEADVSSFSLVEADRDGVLAFYTDGFEGVMPETFKADMYQVADYKKESLNGAETVSSGQALYKTITDENWYMMVPLTVDEAAFYSEQMKKNEDSFLILVTFKKDGEQAYAEAQLLDIDGQNFMELGFNSSMVRYISDRYEEVELGNTQSTGLKIPNSAITQKEFLVVPSEYITENDTSTGTGVVCLRTDNRGEQVEEFVAADVCYEDTGTGNYCIAAENLSLGDTVVAPDSTSRHIIYETAEHDGVYNLNKGYAVFKLIEPISTNGEYTIVEAGTDYGLTQYDRIALDGSSIEEGEFAN